MKTSIIIVSVILVLSVFVPFIIFIYNGVKNTASIKKKTQSLIKNNGIIYGTKDIWRKSFIGISTDNHTLTYMHFKADQPFIRHISLRDIKQCNIIGNYSNNSNKTLSLKNLDLEFVYKSGQPSAVINFFNIDDDLSEDFELQRIEKWDQLIKATLSESRVTKLAS